MINLIDKSRPLIICIVGESASGKTRIEKYIGEAYGIDLIKSYTERAKRPGELADEKAGKPLCHKFLSKGEFDAIDPFDMIAYTKFGDYRYCCVKDDVMPLNTYVIDESGVNILKKNFGHKYDIVTIRITCPEHIRLERSGDQARIDRDKAMFTFDLSEFDYVVDSSVGLRVTKNMIDSIIQHILGSKTDFVPFADCNYKAEY